MSAVDETKEQILSLQRMVADSTKQYIQPQTVKNFQDSMESVMRRQFAELLNISVNSIQIIWDGDTATITFPYTERYITVNTIIE